MKRYIKSSFGLEDKDWMYPENEYNQDFSCVDFLVRGTVATDEKGYFTSESLDNFFYDNHVIDHDEIADMCYGVDVATDDESLLNDIIADMQTKYEGKVQPNTVFNVIAKCHADYYFDIDDYDNVIVESIEPDGCYVDSITVEVA